MGFFDPPNPAQNKRVRRGTTTTQAWQSPKISIDYLPQTKNVSHRLEILSAAADDAQAISTKSGRLTAATPYHFFHRVDGESLLTIFRVSRVCGRYMEVARVWTNISGTTTSFAKYVDQTFPNGMIHKGDTKRVLSFLLAYRISLKR